jgi:archaetidylinositol phosphate synthase
MTYRTWRRILSPVLVPLTRACHKVNPNHITLAALGLAIGAGISFACSTVSVGIVLLGLHVVADYLDGAVARASGRTSKLGDFLDHAADRLADVACLGGLAASGWVRPVVALAALAGSQFLAVANTQVEASTRFRRDPRLSRTDGHVALMAVLIAQGFPPGALAGRTPLEWGLLAVVPFTFLAGIGRLVQAGRHLAKQPADKTMNTH